MARLLAGPSLVLTQANRLARDLLAQGDTLVLRQGQLAAAHRDDQALFETLTTASVPRDHVLVLRSTAGRGDLVVRAQALGTDGYGLDCRRAGSLHERDLPDFAQLFGFTRAEAALVRPLLRGEAPESIAKAQRLSVETVRSHLKSAYAKAGAAGRNAFIGRLLEYLP